jgi:hypothetical protein
VHIVLTISATFDQWDMDFVCGSACFGFLLSSMRNVTNGLCFFDVLRVDLLISEMETLNLTTSYYFCAMNSLSYSYNSQLNLQLIPGKLSK